MNAEDLVHLLAYRVWARKRVLAAVGSVDITQPVISSFPSVRDTLVHLLSADLIWVGRLNGVGPGEQLRPDGFADLAALEARWQGVDDDLRAAAADPDAMVTYRTTAGAEYRQPVRQIILQLINHQTYHFGQIATLLRQMGAAAPAIDLLVYDRTGAGA